MSSIRQLLLRPHRLVRTARFWLTGRRSPQKHVFIWGCPRSGTTLLKSLLVAHPDAAGADRESTGLFNFRDLEAFELGEFSPAEMRRMFEQSHDLVEFYDTVAAALLARRGATVFVDKLQPRRYRLKYVLARFPHARFVNIIRDGRDCYCSARKHPHVVQARSLTGFAGYWGDALSIPQMIVPAARLLTLKYEDLATSPESTLSGLMEFLGLEYESGQTDVARYAATTTLRKREVHQNLAKPINAGSVGRWRTELSAEENRRFCDVAKAAMTRFGYPQD